MQVYTVHVSAERRQFIILLYIKDEKKDYTCNV